MQTEFAKKLRELREAKGFTQSDIAEKMKITSRQVQRYEYQTVPPAEKISALSRLLEYDLFSLLGDIKVPRDTVSAGNEKAPQTTDSWLERLDKLIDNNTKLADSVKDLTGFLNSVGIVRALPSSQEEVHNEDESGKVPSGKLNTRLKDSPGRKKGNAIVKNK